MWVCFKKPRESKSHILALPRKGLCFGAQSSLHNQASWVTIREHHPGHKTTRVVAPINRCLSSLCQLSCGHSVATLSRPLCVHFTFKSSGFFLLRYFFSSTWLPMFTSFASAVSFLSSCSPADSPLLSLVLNAEQSHSARPPHIPHVCLEASACGSGIHPWYHGLCSGQ